MKFTKKILALCTILACLISLPAKAQWDMFGMPRTVVLAAPTILNGGSPAFTNGPIDIHGYQGIGEVTISSCTNSGGALTATLYSSSDNTNLTALANYATSVSTSVLYTNALYGTTNLQVSQTYLLPGTLTAPTVATAGFANGYLVPSPFTNSGALTITTKALYKVGFNVADAGRYLYVVWTPTGSSSNDIVSAEFTGRRAMEVR